MSDILIIDADWHFSQELAVFLHTHGLLADHCQTLHQGMCLLHRGDFKALVLGDGVVAGDLGDQLGELRKVPSLPEVIVVSAEASPQKAEETIRAGAWDYLAKPPNLQRLSVLLGRILDYQVERRSSRAPVHLRRKGIVGSSLALQQCLDQVAHAASGETNVLITGETGTGKELFARAIHANSLRRKKPFVIVDCAALPDKLVESMLFGHERGAFTSADTRSIGLIKQADGATLFLDEIGELPLNMQKVFLRVLEGRSFRPVGSAVEVSSDFRLLAATNRDLEAMVESGEFRRDLFFRLRSIHMELPPLRAITEDINELVCHFIRRYCKRLDKPGKGFSPDFLDALMSYDWPGNTRELMNTVERALSVAVGDSGLFPRHLPRAIRAHVARRSMEKDKKNKPAPDHTTLDMDTFPPLRVHREKSMNEIEQVYMRNLMALTGWDVPAACAVAGVSRPRLYALLKKYGVKRDKSGFSK